MQDKFANRIFRCARGDRCAVEHSTRGHARFTEFRTSVDFDANDFDPKSSCFAIDIVAVAGGQCARQSNSPPLALEPKPDACDGIGIAWLARLVVNVAVCRPRSFSTRASTSTALLLQVIGRCSHRCKRRRSEQRTDHAKVCRKQTSQPNAAASHDKPQSQSGTDEQATFRAKDKWQREQDDQRGDPGPEICRIAPLTGLRGGDERKCE